jgi:single-strand DNA-binding protein
MSKSVNKVILIGNLGRDPELRYTPSGTPVANFSIATTYNYKGQNGEWKESTDWHNIVCWRRLAEVAGDYLRKGSRIYVEGRITTRSWEGQDGKTNYRTEIVVNDLMMLDSRGEGGGGGGRSSGGSRSSSGPDDSGFEPDQISDDDIPF